MLLRMTRWWGLVLLVGAACSRGPVHLALQRSTVPSYLEVAAVEATLEGAAETWQACGQDVVLDDEGENLAFFGSTGDDSIGAMASTRDGWTKFSDWPSIWATDGEPCEGADGYRLILGTFARHEIGHLLGYGHEADARSFMHAGSPVCTDLRTADVCHPRVTDAPSSDEIR